jgi:hypothetical protein
VSEAVATTERVFSANVTTCSLHVALLSALHTSCTIITEVIALSVSFKRLYMTALTYSY